MLNELSAKISRRPLLGPCVPILLALSTLAAPLAGASAASAASAVPAGRVEVGVSKTHFIACSPPVYPEEARRKHLEGAGVFQLVFNQQGHVFNVKTLRSTGKRELDVACLVAFFKWRTRPLEFPKVNIPVSFIMSSSPLDPQGVAHSVPGD